MQRREEVVKEDSRRIVTDKGCRCRQLGRLNEADDGDDTNRHEDRRAMR